jgi:hypothetical protein
MVFRIARRELLDLSRDGRFRAAITVIGVLVLENEFGGVGVDQERRKHGAG